MIFHAVGRSWSSIFIKLVLALAADSFGLRDVFDVRPGSYLTNSFPGVSGGNCDEFVHDLEPTIPKIQRILAEFEAVTNDENFAHMPIHVKSSINNYWLDPRQRFSKKPLVLGQVTARWDRLKGSFSRWPFHNAVFLMINGTLVIVSGLSDFFNGRSLSTFRPLLKCNDRYLRWTEYYMYPDGSASNVLVNMSGWSILDCQLSRAQPSTHDRIASTPDGVWGMYWVDDQAKYGGFARQPADPSKIDITFHGKWPPKNRPGGMWGGPCDLGSPPAQAIFTEVAPGVHNGHVLHLCRETNPDPNIIWMSEFPQGVRLDDLRRKHDQQQPHRQGDWIDPQIFEDWSWIIIHETLHLLSGECP